jgi:excisionase family DNA binding protein
VRAKLMSVPALEIGSREAGDHIAFLFLGRVERFLLPSQVRQRPGVSLEAMTVAGVTVVDHRVDPKCSSCGAPSDGAHIALDGRPMLQGMADESGEPLANETENLWTIHEVAEWLNCAEDSVYRLVASGRIPSMRLERRLRFSPEEVKTAMREGVK